MVLRGCPLLRRISFCSRPNPGYWSSFSTSAPVSAGMGQFFRRKTHPTVDPPAPGEIVVEPTEVDLMKKEVLRSKSLGLPEKQALQRIIDKGLGKTILPYQPPENVQEKMQKIFQDLFGRLNAAEPLRFQFPDRASKFQFLTACEKAFSHSVPNSKLYEMNTLEDVLDFYLDPVVGTNGLTQYQRMTDLPANLHINYEPVRFDPDHDPVYGGVTAFPHSHTFVTGLKYKKMYQSRKSYMNWPKVLDCTPMRRGHFPTPFNRTHH